MLLSTLNRLTSTLVVQFHNAYVPAHGFLVLITYAQMFHTFIITTVITYIEIR